MPSSKTLLICTVGGSHQPIVTAIRSVQPDFVCFVCSEDDPETKHQGSYTQILTPGKCIKSKREKNKNDLPNIPTQTGLSEDSFVVRRIPTDDLEQAFSQITEKLETWKKEFTEARIIADYTGGTKSMTGAMILAALEQEGVELQLITGGRQNLLSIKEDEYGVLASVQKLRLRKRMNPLIQLWQSFSYEQAGRGMSELLRSTRGQNTELKRLRGLSLAFAAWHRCDYPEAQRLLSVYKKVFRNTLSSYLQTLSFLCKPSNRQEPMKLLDLELNIERRIAQGHYDEAVAISYRLWEWTAQWLLKHYCGIQTADIQKSDLPDSIVIHPNHDGKIQAGLFKAWELLEYKRPESPAGIFFKQQRKHLKNIVLIRNQSIFAHGFKPISQAEWEEIKSWMDDYFLPMLHEECRNAGVSFEPPQLPTLPFELA